MLLSSQMKEIASNKGEKVQPQVCVAGLSERKFSVNDLQVQENCSDEPISGRGGCRFSDTGEKVQVTLLRRGSQRKWSCTSFSGFNGPGL